jgi:hypothetical protein
MFLLSLSCDSQNMCKNHLNQYMRVVHRYQSTVSETRSNKIEETYQNSMKSPDLVPSPRKVSFVIKLILLNKVLVRGCLTESADRILRCIRVEAANFCQGV